MIIEAHDVAILGGFVVLEILATNAEHWFHHAESGIRAARHSAMLVWVFHPSVLNAATEWGVHLIVKTTTVLVGGGH